MCLKGAPYKIYFYWLMKILLYSHVHISDICTLFFFFTKDPLNPSLWFTKNHCL